MGREVPFVCLLNGQVLRGSMDLLYRAEGCLWVADYKTDVVPNGRARLHAQHYAPQGAAYKAAVEKALNEPCGFQVIFLRTPEAVEVFPAERLVAK